MLKGSPGRVGLSIHAQLKVVQLCDKKKSKVEIRVSFPTKRAGDFLLARLQ
jgi:hypothetical protein